MNIDWKQKLTSRKFWAALIGFITSIMTALGISNISTEQVVAVVSAASVLIAYIISEGIVDASRTDSKENTEQ